MNATQEDLLARMDANTKEMNATQERWTKI
jgi:hypothetical protein